MATKKKPARRAARSLKTPAAQLPAVQEVRVRWAPDCYHARAAGMSVSCTSSDILAVRRLAAKLGYSANADVRFVRVDDDGSARPPKVFEIVEVSRG